MLYNYDNCEFMSKIPHIDMWNLILCRLTSVELTDIQIEINNYCFNKEVIHSSFIPGSDWTGTVYEPIYEKAALKHQEVAAKMFGLIVWVTMSQRKDVWGFGKYPVTGREFEGMTYFKRGTK